MKTFNKGSILAAIIGFAAIGSLGPIVALAAGPAGVSLGSAGNFAILAKTGISTTGSTSIVGDVGLSPAAASYITGFALTLPAASAFSTSALVTGKIYAPGYADPTPANITAAVSDMETAYTDAAGRTNPTATELGAGNIGGLTLAPGLYKWSTGVTIPTDITLSGGANDVWIFQIAQNLNVSSAVKVVLSGGAKASNVFWVVAGQTTVGTTAVFNGNILDQTTIVLNTGATLNGRALAQAAVTLDSNAVTIPTFATPATVTPITTTTSGVACAMDVMQCSDGSYVARQGPSCAFAACPAAASTQSVSSNAARQVRSIVVNLGKGSRNNDVITLQQFLISQNKGPAAAALANVGATAYFGAITRAALAEFQASVGISPALGNFGAITRAYINAH
jgi:hypothetical protein